MIVSHPCYQTTPSHVHKILVYPKREIKLLLSWLWNFFKLRNIYNINWIPQGYLSLLFSGFRSMKKLEDLILTYKDFPKGIDFKDVLEILQPRNFSWPYSKNVSTEFLKCWSNNFHRCEGFIFGSAVALQLSKPMIVARKTWKVTRHINKRRFWIWKILFQYKVMPWKIQFFCNHR